MDTQNICVICAREGHRANHCPWYIPLSDGRAWLLPLLSAAAPQPVPVQLGVQ